MTLRRNPEKDKILKRERGISFDEVEAILRSGEELDNLPHPMLPNQRILVVLINGYVCAVPFIEDGRDTLPDPCFHHL